MGRNGLPLVSDAMDSNNALPFHKEPEHSGVELADMSQFKEPIAERFGQRLPMILPVTELCESGDNSGEIVRVRGIQLIQKVPNRACTGLCRIKFYCEKHGHVNINIDVLSADQPPQSAAAR